MNQLGLIATISSQSLVPSSQVKYQLSHLFHHHHI